MHFSSNFGDNLAWIDTEGWDDSSSDDLETFQSILQFLNRHNLTRLKAVIWNVHPASIRQDATLDKQAKLINMFAEKDIWDNVIIVCKFSNNHLSYFNIKKMCLDFRQTGNESGA